MANEEAGFGTIKCPGCGEAIPISEAIHHQIAERTRQEFRAEALEARRLLAARERELDEKAAALDRTVSDRLAAERANLSKEIEAQLRSGLSTEIADLKRQADERSERLAKAQAVELELRTEKRNLQEKEKARDLEIARKLDEEQVRLQQEISTRLEEEHARQVAEKDKRLSDAMKANDELRRKLQQGSQQLQGEVLELALEDLISQTFPSDLVQPVPTGINGADITVVFDPVAYLLNLRDCRDLFIGQLHTDIVKANEDLSNADGLGIVRDFRVDIFVNEDRIDLKQMFFEKQFDGVKDCEDGVLAARIRAFLLEELEADA